MYNRLGYIVGTFPSVGSNIISGKVMNKLECCLGSGYNAIFVFLLQSHGKLLNTIEFQLFTITTGIADNNELR